MKNKNLLLVLFCLSISLSVHSQNFRFSFLANPQIAWLSGDNNGFETKGSLLKINTGIEMDIFFTENYAFSTGLTINSMGGGVSYEDSVYMGSEGNETLLEPGNILDYSLQYLAVPIGLKFKTIEIGYSTFWLNTGINTMLNIKARASDELGDFDNTDISDDIGGLNFNYFVEAGIEYSIGGNTAIITGLGYNSGILDVTNRPSEKLTTQSVSLIFGILF